MRWAISALAISLATTQAASAGVERHAPVPSQASGPYLEARQSMVIQVRRQLRRAGLRDDARLREILEAIGRLPRELYVSSDQRDTAYQLSSLPIGHGQTISDPFIVAYMTRKLDLRRRDRVLEIGTGSGYQAALLGSLVDDVYTIEIVPDLARRAAATLEEQGFRNVHVRQGDGYAGWPEAAPFDAIIVTAGAARIPPALFDQLRPGGRMIMPLGPNWADLRMTLITKTLDGRAQIERCGWVMFVPFVGQAQTLEAGAPGVRPAGRSGRCAEPLGMQFTPADARAQAASSR